MPRFLRFGLIGCGGLLGLVVLFIGCAAVIGGGDSEAPSSVAEREAEDGGATPSPETPSPEPEEQTVAVGETVEVGDVAWTVSNTRQATQLNSQFLEPKQGNFVIVDFAFTNNGNEPITLRASTNRLATFHTWRLSE